MFQYYRLRNAAAFEKEVNHRAACSLFDYTRLAADLPYAPHERVIDNNLYGYAEALKRYGGVSKDLKAYMEHGLFLGGIVHKDQFNWHYPKMICMSLERVNILQKALPEKQAIAVGPYIHYAENLLNAKAFKALKKRLGKVLLVFPFHSMKGVQAGFEEDKLIQEIGRIAKDYDSVLISLYFLDAQVEGRARAYLEAGFKVVTAGHKFDPNFIQRQRTHIELADMTMSNGMGTQTGYCIYLNKPHYIFNQHIEQKAKSRAEASRHEAIAGQTEKERVQAERAYFSELFGTYQTHISKVQQEAVSRFWGFEEIKTKEEVRQLFG